MSLDARKVLIADADPALRQQLFSALLEQDIFSDCVNTVGEALEKLDVERYGVAVLDIGLPGGEIDIVLARIAEMAIADRPVVLVLAARPEATRTLDVDIVQIVLRRPVRLSQLVDVVRSCLRSFTARPAAPPRNSKGDHLIS